MDYYFLCDIKGDHFPLYGLARQVRVTFSGNILDIPLQATMASSLDDKEGVKVDLN